MNPVLAKVLKKTFATSATVVGALFGTQRSNTTRNETIILITARIVRNNAEARNLTDEYSRRFRAMEPLHRAKD